MQFWQIDLPIPKMHLTRPIALLPVAHLLVTDCTDGARVPNPQLMRHWEEKDERGTALFDKPQTDSNGGGRSIPQFRPIARSRCKRSNPGGDRAASLRYELLMARSTAERRTRLGPRR